MSSTWLPGRHSAPSRRVSSSSASWGLVHIDAGRAPCLRNLVGIGQRYVPSWPCSVASATHLNVEFDPVARRVVAATVGIGCGWQPQSIVIGERHGKVGLIAPANWPRRRTRAVGAARRLGQPHEVVTASPPATTERNALNARCRDSDRLRERCRTVGNHGGVALRRSERHQAAGIARGGPSS
jgi:hypothetical protein